MTNEGAVGMAILVGFGSALLLVGAVKAAREPEWLVEIRREAPEWPAGSRIVGVTSICVEQENGAGEWAPALLDARNGSKPVRGAAVSGMLYAPPGAPIRLLLGCKRK